MQIIPIYRYTRLDGGVSVSPIKPNCDYVTMVRLIASENKVLVKNGYITKCIDTDTSDGWTEANMSNESIEE